MNSPTPRPPTFAGRQFSSADLELIRQVASDFAGLGITEIARTACELLEWKRPSGGLKNPECRRLIEHLAGQGRLRLPKRRGCGGWRARPSGESRAVQRTTRPASLSGLSGAVRRQPALPGARRAGARPGAGVPVVVLPGLEDACARQLPADWEKLYGYRPLLLETLVDGERFHGTCYRAANWIKLGQTTGRGRMDRQHAAHGEAVKDLYVYPLCRHVAERLRSGTAPVGKEPEEETSRWRG
jgi:hypothetical protein